MEAMNLYIVYCTSLAVSSSPCRSAATSVWRNTPSSIPATGTANSCNINHKIIASRKSSHSLGDQFIKVSRLEAWGGSVHQSVLIRGTASFHIAVGEGTATFRGIQIWEWVGVQLLRSTHVCSWMECRYIRDSTHWSWRICKLFGKQCESFFHMRLYK